MFAWRVTFIHYHCFAPGNFPGSLHRNVLLWAAFRGALGLPVSGWWKICAVRGVAPPGPDQNSGVPKGSITVCNYSSPTCSQYPKYPALAPFPKLVLAGYCITLECCVRPPSGASAIVFSGLGPGCFGGLLGALAACDGTIDQKLWGPEKG